jgi:hypothetical protein
MIRSPDDRAATAQLTAKGQKACSRAKLISFSQSMLGGSSQLPRLYFDAGSENTIRIGSLQNVLFSDNSGGIEVR